MNGMEFIVFPAVGAAIGAVTNQIAIRMLFRPYEPVRIFGRRVPLTPGVIPAQRHTIAANIAHTFEKRLLSRKELHEAITGARATALLESKVGEMLRGLGPLAGLARRLQPTIVRRLQTGLEELADDAVGEGGSLDVRQRIEDRINAMDIATLEELILGFSRQQFRYITWFGGLLGALIGLVQAGLVHFLP